MSTYHLDPRMAYTTCVYCGDPIRWDGRGWIDATDGDCCSGDDACVNENAPHQAGTGVAPDVEILPFDDGETAESCWYVYMRPATCRPSEIMTGADIDDDMTPYESEAAALHAARVAAGFGHVAERPCTNFHVGGLVHSRRCIGCAWPFDRHTEREPR